MRQLGLVLLLLTALPVQAAETVLQLPTRGSVMRVLIDAPAAAQAAVILLAGGSGRLDIADNGRIRALGGNQLVRTRAAYARAGYVTATIDVAEDFKQGADGVRSSYRWSAEHAADIGTLIAHLRDRVPLVYLVGTSRGALTAANAAARLEGTRKPDAIVITSGMLMHMTDSQPSVQTVVRSLDRIAMPVLLVAHEKDACAYTPAGATPRFRALLTASPRVDIVMLTGGQADPPGQECEAAGYHGFAGLDADVVRTVTGWLKTLP